MAGLGLCSKGICRMVTSMTYNMSEMDQSLSEMKIEEDPGCFSFESSLFQAIVSLDKMKSSFHREILVIQSSPMTKDQHSLFSTVRTLR